MAAGGHQSILGRPDAIVGMKVGDVRRRDQHDAASPILDHVLGGGIDRVEVAHVQGGVADGGRVITRAEILADVLALRVPADLVDRERVPAAMNLERDLAPVES